MRVKKIKVQIKSLDDVLSNFVDVAKKIKKKKKVASSKGVYLANLETARGIFTEARLQIISILKKKNPKSIYALAKLLKRDFKNVYTDVSFLSELGIISIEENKEGRREKKPKLVCSKILFDIAA